MNRCVIVALLIVSLVSQGQIAHGQIVKQDSVRSGLMHNEITSEISMLDTLKPDSAVRAAAIVREAADSVVDSISRTVNKTNAMLQRPAAAVDTIQQKLARPMQKLNEEVNGLKTTVARKTREAVDSVNAQINRLENKIDEGLSRATDGTITRSEANINLTTENINVPELPVEADITSTVNELSSAPVEMPELNLKTLTESPDAVIPFEEEIGDINEVVTDLDSRIGEAQQAVDEVQAATESVQTVDELSETAEQQVGRLEAVEHLEAEKAKFTAKQLQMEALIQRYRDKKALQREIERKALNVANDKLNKNVPQFKEAQTQLAKAKKLNPAVDSYKQMKQKRVNEMAGRPFHEHLLPGIAIQAYNHNKILATDLTAQLGYRLSGRMLLGAGGVYRTSFSENHKLFVRGEKIYGYRTYLNFSLYKSFYAHGEYCALFGNVDQLLKENVVNKVGNGYFGIGKRYDISRKLKGSILVLYRASIEGDIPSISRLNMRIEFNLDTKKRSKRLSKPENNK